MEDYSEQILLVNVWASWCGPCRVEMPDLDELQEHFADEPFTVLGVAADNIAGVKDYLKAVPVAYPNYAGDPDQVFGWSQKLGNHHLGVPFTALVDTTGAIRWTKMGGGESRLMRWLRKLNNCSKSFRWMKILLSENQNNYDENALKLPQ